jgi:hypothetical protein
MTGTPLPAPSLHTARLRLRPFDDADANDLFALHSNAYVLRYWDAPPWRRGRRTVLAMSGRLMSAARSPNAATTAPGSKSFSIISRLVKRYARRRIKSRRYYHLPDVPYALRRLRHCGYCTFAWSGCFPRLRASLSRSIT